jgi:hypothetical protein
VHPAGLADAFADVAHAWFDWAVDPAWVVLVPDVMVGAAEVLCLAPPTHRTGSQGIATAAHLLVEGRLGP